MNLKSTFLLLFSMQSMSLMAQTQITDADLTNAYSKVNISRKGNLCHDPSIVIDNTTNPMNPTYYIYGSHLGHGKTYATANYQNWSTWGDNEDVTTATSKSLFADANGNRVNYSAAYNTNAVTKVKNYKGEEVAFTGFNMHNWQRSGGNIAGNQWAPDVIYNKKMNKWCMYMSINSDDWCSGIVLLTSNSIEGPWVYQGPVVFSGFCGSFAHVGYAATDDWKKTDYAIATGETTLPTRYKVGSNWKNYWPNAIDPCVLYDDNDDLWMSYGSWFGGIFMIRLDNETGLRDYTHTYQYKEGGVVKTPGAANQACDSDPYFGIKIAGGYGVSGEASYIQKIGNYYYLWITNGGLTTKGGYQMRVYRSSNITGPYQDPWPLNAMPGKSVKNYGSDAGRDYGVKLFGNYKWEFMPYSEIAQGHNSVTIDHKGRILLVNHVRFKEVGHEGHEVRVHQLFMTKDGWPVASPYEFSGETVIDNDIATSALYTNEQICGDYELMIHKFRQNTAAAEVATPVNITLNADGTISGSYTGTWSCPANTSYIDIKLDKVLGTSINATFHGVLTMQTIDNTNIKSLCFTCCGTQKSETTQASSGAALTTSGLCIWGSKANYKAAIKCTLDKMVMPVYDNQTITSSVTFPTAGKLGSKISWKSDNTSVISDNGLVKANGNAKITMSIEKDGYVYKKDFNITVNTEGVSVPTPVYFNDFSSTDGLTIVGSGEFITDSDERFGQIYHNDPNLTKKIRSNYLLLPENVLSHSATTKQMSIGVWVNKKNAADYFFSPLFTAYEKKNTPNTWPMLACQSRGVLQLNCAGWSDYTDAQNVKGTNAASTTWLDDGKWHYYCATFTATTATVYVDGEIVNQWNIDGTTNTAAGLFSNGGDLKYVCLGGNQAWEWNDPDPAYGFDDIAIYDKVLTADQIKSIMESKNTTGILPIYIERPASHDNIIRNLSGQRVGSSFKGVVIKNGRKYIQK